MDKEKETENVIFGSKTPNNVEKKIEKNILRKFAEYLETEHFLNIAKENSARGAKCRTYRRRFKKDELTTIAALALMLDMEMIEGIEYKF